MHVTLFDTGSPFVATVADLLEGLGMEFVRTAELPLPTQGPVDLGVVVVPVSGDAVDLLAERMAVLDGPHAAASHRRAFAVFEDDDVAASIACSTQCCFDEVGLAAEVDDGDQKGQGGDGQHVVIALCGRQSQMSQGKAKAEAFVVSKGMLNAHPSSIGKHDMMSTKSLGR